jgi:hypothetical protein
MLRSLDITTWSNQSLREYKKILENELKQLRENEDFKALQNLDGEYKNVVSILHERRLNGDI